MKNLAEFETERLRLLAITTADAPNLLELMNTPKWLRYIGDRKIHSIPDAARYITEKITPQFEKLGYGNYKVIRKSDGVFLGNCGIYDRPGLEGVDIGFAFLPAYEKKGYAYEAALKMKKEGFGRFGIETISAITLPSNLDAQKLLERLGLTFVRMVRLKDEEEELMFYQIHKSIILKK